MRERPSDRLTVEVEARCRALRGGGRLDCTARRPAAPPGANRHSARSTRRVSGWKDEDNWRQWNSCTSRYRGPRYQPDDPQVSRPNYENQHARKTIRGPRGRTCASIHSGRTHIFRNEYMKLYELDLWDYWLGGNGSDYVTAAGGTAGRSSSGSETRRPRSGSTSRSTCGDPCAKTP